MGPRGQRGRCYNAHVSTPQEEALAVFASAVENLTTGGADLKLVLRRCIHAARLLGWGENLSWLEAELNGFRSDQSLPGYRRQVRAYTTWRGHTIEANIRLTVTEDRAGKPTETWFLRDMRAGVSELVWASAAGFATLTGKEDSRRLGSWNQDVPVEEVEVVPKESIAGVLRGVEDALFQYVSQAYTVLRFGDAVGDVWRDYRSRVDQALARIGLEGHLEAIRTGLEADNPERWRQAMWACRDLLRDLAAHLWQDRRDTYPHLKDDKGGPILVKSDKYVNRLAAYLHQKGLTGTMGAYLRAELDRINSSMHALNDLYSEAHDPVSREDARLAAVTVYTLLGELVGRTDMQPIVEYR